MNVRSFVRFSGCGLALGGAALALQGCGGGSSATGTTPRAALTGTVTAPQSQTRGVKSTRDADPLVPVAGASVSLVNLDDTTTAGGSIAGTTTTGANGSYSFPTVIPGTNYKIEATKAIGNKTLKLDAIVTAPAADTGSGSGAAPPAPVAHDLTPTSTVAAVTTLQQIAVLKSVDPTAKNNNLQAIADDLAKKRDDAHLPPPDLTDPDAVAAAVTTLKQSAAPIGSYAGTATTTVAAAGSNGDTVGGTNRLAAQIDVAGKFFLMALPGDKTSTTATGGNGSGGDTGSNGSSNGNGGSSGGSGTGTATHGGDNGSDFAVGTVTADGIVNATTKNGKVKVTGLFTGGVGVGTWSQTDGSASGIWSLALLTKPYSGLYAGKHYTDVQGSNNGSGGNGNNSGSGAGSNNSGGSGGNGSSNTGGSNGSSGAGSNGTGTAGSGGSDDFALLVLDNGTCYIMGSNGGGNQPTVGIGTVSSAGALTFQLKNDDGMVITGTGQIDAAHRVTGTYSDTSGEAGHFAGRSNHADTSDL